MTLLLALSSGFVFACLAPALPRLARRWTGWAAAAGPAALFAVFVALAPQVLREGAVTARVEWAPGIALALVLRLDGWSLLFALLITGIGAGVAIYAGRYLEGHPRLGRFYLLLLLFLASMLGLVLSEHLLALFVFWELTSLTSYFLIGFDHHRPQARAAALQGLLITVGGGQALLLGLLLLGWMGGSYELGALAAQRGALLAHPLYPAAALLVIAGAVTKSAQFPFHFWLPGAMAAPTPVSAFLHSATMVKAGVYLLASLGPVLGGTPLWTGTLTTVGGLTMVLGAVLALRPSDLKQILAYATVSVLGLLTFLIGLGTPAALQALPVFLLGHALYKGSLFLVAGSVDHGAGTREVTALGGLRGAMPWTAAAALLAALAMAGIAPAFGFVGKELVYEAALGASSARWIAAATLVTFVPMVAVAALVSVGVFLGRARPAAHPAHEPPPGMVAVPLVLAGMGVALGAAPGVLDGWMSRIVVELHPGAPATHLGLWHGFTPALALSAVSLAAGLTLYRFRAPVTAALRGLPDRLSGARAYDAALAGMLFVAGGQTRLLQSGLLRRYVLFTFLTAAVAAGYALWTRGGLPPAGTGSGLRVHELGVAALMLVAAAVAVRSRSRLGAVAAMGVVGFGVALIFLFFGAPDLALTQAIVEALTVVVFLLALLHLPRYRELSVPRARIRDAVIALGFGAVMTLLVLAATASPSDHAVARYFLEESVPSAHGRNVVNVILVDFRALDTLGEITVLAVAAVGVVALLKLRARRGTGPKGEEAP